MRGLLGNAAAYQQRAGMLGGRPVAGPGSFQARGGGGFAAPGGGLVRQPDALGAGIGGLGQMGAAFFEGLEKQKQAAALKQQADSIRAGLTNLNGENRFGVDPAVADVLRGMDDATIVQNALPLVQNAAKQRAEAEEAGMKRVRNEQAAVGALNVVAPVERVFQSGIGPIEQRTMNGQTLGIDEVRGLQANFTEDPELRRSSVKDAITPKEPKSSTGVKWEFEEWKKTNPGGTFKDFYNWRQSQKKPLVSMGGELEREEEKAEGKRLVAAADEVFKRGLIAREQLDQLRLLASLPLDEEGLVGKAQVFLGSIGRGLGFTEKQLATFNLDGATNAQSFQSIAMEMVLSKLAAQTGPQTDQDAQRVISTVATLGNTPEARQFIIRAASNVARNASAKSRFLQEHYENEKTYQGAFKKWDDMMYETPLTGQSEDGEIVFYYEEMDRLKAENPQADIETLNEYWRAAYGN